MMVVSLRHVGITDWDKGEVENDHEYACQQFCSENAPWNTIRPHGLASPVQRLYFVGGGPFERHSVVIVKALKLVWYRRVDHGLHSIMEVSTHAHC